MLAMALCCIEGFHQRALNVPPSQEALAQGAPSQTYRFSPFTQAFRFTPEGDASILAMIALLLKVRSPAAVARFVVPVNVDPVEAVSGRWTPPHVSQERLKAVTPRIANSNTTSTIVGILRHVWIQATRFHTEPRSVLRGALACALFTVSDLAPTEAGHTTELRGAKSVRCDLERFAAVLAGKIDGHRSSSLRCRAGGVRTAARHSFVGHHYTQWHGGGGQR